MLGVAVKGLTESNKDKLAEALATIISGDRARTLVTMGELAQFKGRAPSCVAKIRHKIVQRCGSHSMKVRR